MDGGRVRTRTRVCVREPAARSFVRSHSSVRTTGLTRAQIHPPTVGEGAAQQPLVVILPNRSLHPRLLSVYFAARAKITRNRRVVQFNYAWSFS